MNQSVVRRKTKKFNKERLEKRNKKTIKEPRTETHAYPPPNDHSLNYLAEPKFPRVTLEGTGNLNILVDEQKGLDNKTPTHPSPTENNAPSTACHQHVHKEEDIEEFCLIGCDVVALFPSLTSKQMR